VHLDCRLEYYTYTTVRSLGRKPYPVRTCMRPDARAPARRRRRAAAAAARGCESEGSDLVQTALAAGY
jgi:hypothetical protein